MRTRVECLPCFLRQAAIAVELAGSGEVLREAVMRDVHAIVSDVDLSKSPAYTTSFIHRRIRKVLGVDPYHAVKRKYNRIALERYAALRHRVQASPDPLHTAVRLAIAGNIIDFGIFHEIQLDQTLEQAQTVEFFLNAYEEFQHRVQKAENIVYLFDNAGEIVFDRLLVEELVRRGTKVTGVVKGGPVINDATREDAVQAGLTDLIPVITNGSDDVGTYLPNCSPELHAALDRADLLLSKGQANFETLYLDLPDAFFLFQAKCDVLAAELQVAKGAMILGTRFGQPREGV